jgi:hypothetical protein
MNDQLEGGVEGMFGGRAVVVNIAVGLESRGGRCGTCGGDGDPGQVFPF